MNVLGFICPVIRFDRVRLWTKVTGWDTHLPVLRPVPGAVSWKRDVFFPTSGRGSPFLQRDRSATAGSLVKGTGTIATLHTARSQAPELGSQFQGLEGLCDVGSSCPGCRIPLAGGFAKCKRMIAAAAY